jgi:DNA-binding beta-propeller fold protein YncE
VARALAAGASVLVMDEPLVHVDWTRAWKYWDVIQRRIAATGVSLVFSTHSPRTVLGEADSVIALRDGRVLYQGEVDDLYRRPATLELAECLGEANWLLPAEARLWLEREVAEPCCLRPEQISVVAAERSPIVVESSRFHGAVAEVELRHEATGAQRKFFHRPAANHLRKGDRVLIKALLLVLLLAQLALAGCGQSETSTIPFREARYWSVPPDGAKTPAPRCITVGRNDETIVVDTAGRVLVYDKDGQVKRHWKMPETERGKPEGVCMLSDGRIVVCDTHYHRVFFFDQTGNVLGQFGREGVEPGQFAYPVGVTRDDRDNLYVTEYGGNDRVQKFSRDGQFLLAFGRFGTRPGEFQRPAGLAWHAGKVYVLDAVNNRIQVFTDDGKFLSILGAPDKPLSLRFPFDITLGGDGAFYVIEYGEGRISKLSLDGKLLGRYGRSGGGAGHFTTPWGITVDAKMRLRVADAGNRRIVELNP